MTASRVYKISVDFIGKEKTWLRRQISPIFSSSCRVKHLAYRVVRAAQQHQLGPGVCRAAFQVLEIHLVMPVLKQERIVGDLPPLLRYCVGERTIHRPLENHPVARPL